MGTIYTMQLQVTPQNGKRDPDVYGDLISKIGRWVEGKYQRAWKTAVSMPTDENSLVPMQGHTVSVTSRITQDAGLFTLDWTHPADDDPSTAWVANAIVGRNGDVVQIAVLLRI